MLSTGPVSAREAWRGRMEKDGLVQSAAAQSWVTDLNTQPTVHCMLTNLLPELNHNSPFLRVINHILTARAIISEHPKTKLSQLVKGSAMGRAPTPAPRLSQPHRQAASAQTAAAPPNPPRDCGTAPQEGLGPSLGKPECCRSSAPVPGHAASVGQPSPADMAMGSHLDPRSQLEPFSVPSIF